MPRVLFTVLLLFVCRVSWADGNHFERVVVYGKQSDLIGQSLSASEGVIGYGDIELRPTLRVGEIMEFVPGMVVTQHSGSGKANQYFLRGFNLDHGTDFAINLDNMPLNMRSHGHGQGYADLNFITPEFIQQINYQKGPYRATQGDFATAGSANFSLKSEFARPFAKIELGENGYWRSVGGTNIQLNEGKLAAGAEWQQYDGPWTDTQENVKKKSAFLRYRNSLAGGELSLSILSYDNQWYSADQIPLRAVKSGLIDELGSLDNSLGGNTQRHSVSVNWQSDNSVVSAYAIESGLNLFSNFTYRLNDPLHGDQFEQVDDRQLYGASVSRFFSTELDNVHIHHVVGLDTRYDRIKELGLYQTQQRQRLSTVRTDQVDEYSIAAFYQTNIAIGDNILAHVGVRRDYLNVDVTSDMDVNSGRKSDSINSLRGGISYIINDYWQAYFNAGQSFHSNDARGAVIQRDPVSKEPAAPVDLLVQGRGSEMGIRVANYRAYNASLSIWLLENDSELVFVGDAGNTEASRPSKRWGIEFASYFWLSRDLTTDIEVAWTHSRFTEDTQDEGLHIDGALPLVASVGLQWQINDRWRSDARMRHFGKRTLDGHAEHQSDRFTVVNGSVSYLRDNWQVTLSLLNLFDSRDHDIDYWYASRLDDEPVNGVEDLHYHPIEPRTLRLALNYQF